jgi:hypothetical protein
VSRRVSLPGADLLFRPHPEPPSEPPPGSPDPGAAPAVPSEGGAEPHAGAADPPGGAADGTTVHPDAGAPGEAEAEPHASGARTPAGARSGGRQRHEEKITVYMSAAELLDLERARLTLRAEHGLAADRGRVVRAAVAVLLADLDARGESSALVQRLREP